MGVGRVARPPMLSNPIQSKACPMFGWPGFYFYLARVGPHLHNEFSGTRLAVDVASMLGLLNSLAPPAIVVRAAVATRRCLQRGDTPPASITAQTPARRRAELLDYKRQWHVPEEPCQHSEGTYASLDEAHCPQFGCE